MQEEGWKTLIQTARNSETRQQSDERWRMFKYSKNNMENARPCGVWVAVVTIKDPRSVNGNMQ